jgi:hypothetical protein
MEIMMKLQTVGVKQLGELLGITPRRAQQLVAEHVLTRDAHGQYNLVQNVRAYVRHLEASPKAEILELRKEKGQFDLNQSQMRAKLDSGELIARASMEAYLDSMKFGTEKSFQLLNRILINYLWPKNFKDVAFVESACSDCSSAFAAWMHHVHDMANRGATAQDIKTFLFNAHATPPTGPVDFGTEQTRRRRKARKEAE